MRTTTVRIATPREVRRLTPREQYEKRGESDCAERHRRRHVPQHVPAVLANSILRAVYRASGCAVAFSLGRELLVNIGNGFHERPKFRIGLKLGLRSDPTRYRAKHFR